MNAVEQHLGSSGSEAFARPAVASKQLLIPPSLLERARVLSSKRLKITLFLEEEEKDSNPN